MMPRPILVDNFNLTYRKIPVLAIGRDIVIDTSLIVEYLHGHPELRAWREQQRQQDEYKGQEIHHDVRGRSLARAFSSFFTDRPLFRLTTGLIPSVVWRTKFGEDRAGLIGHQLDPAKLERKVPRNLASLDTYLSLLEPMFDADADGDGGRNAWVLGTEKPSLADVSLYYQLEWGEKISRGEGIEDLTGGGAGDGTGEGMGKVFNEKRYSGLWDWFHRFEDYIDALPVVETRLEKEDAERVEVVMRALKDTAVGDDVLMLSTPNPRLDDLEERLGIKYGRQVSIAPDDTGKGDPTVGKLIGLSPEEIVIEPDTIEGKARVEGIRLHFPRVGFVVSPLRDSKL